MATLYHQLAKQWIWFSFGGSSRRRSGWGYFDTDLLIHDCWLIMEDDGLLLFGTCVYEEGEVLIAVVALLAWMTCL